MSRGIGCATAIAALLVTATAAWAGHATVSRAQLALMPLPKPALGPGAGLLQLDPGSGVESNKDAADNANGKATADTFARLGRITGYHLHYVDPAFTAFTTGHGLFDSDIGVELYKSEQDAAGGLAFWKADVTKAALLKSIGVTVTVRPFATSGLGVESVGFAGVSRYQGRKVPMYGGVVAFRTGPIVATVSVSGADPGVTRPLLIAVAQKLESRIALVLAGKLSGPPVPLPGKATAGPPPNGPSLVGLALTTGDLGGGHVVHQGYQLDADLTPISEYVRSFSPGGAFADLTEAVSLFHSSTETSLKFGLLAAAFSSPTAALLKASKIASIKQKAVPVKAGDESRAFLAATRLTDGTQYDEGIVLVRVGSTLEFVDIMARPGSIQPAALRDVATLAASRARQGLG